MALGLVSGHTTLTLSLVSGAKFILRRSLISPQRNMARYLSIRAVQESEGPRRLVDIIRIIPDISRNYFRSRPRRALFGGISLLGGFYVAQTISLSFGALGVNDVIAAVVCVLLTEYVTRFYYSRPKEPTPKVAGKANQKCLLMDITGDKRVVAEGRWFSNDPDQVVHFEPLGPNAVHVWVDIVKVKDAEVWRPSSFVECMEDALGFNLAWPEAYVVLV